MATKQREIEYITKFNLCDREHFLILKGISILVILIALFCESFLHIPYGKPVVSIAAVAGGIHIL